MSDSLVKEGLLSYLSKGSFIKKYNSKECHVKLLDASRSGLARLELYEGSRSSQSSNHFLVLASGDIVKVIQDESPSQNEGCGFTVTTKTQQHHFLAKNVVKSQKWVEAIQETLLKPCSPVYLSTQSHVMQDNDMYLSSDEVLKGFIVQVDRETRMKLGMEGSMRLMVKNCNITVVSMDGKMITRWAINKLRKTGYTSDNFHIEAGSKSTSGEGVFTFLTSQGAAIIGLVDQEKNYMKHCHMRTHARDSYNTRQFPTTQDSTPTSPLVLASSRPTEPFIPDHTYETIDFNTTKRDLSSSCEDLQVRPSFKPFTRSVMSLDGHIPSLKQEQVPHNRNSSESYKLPNTMKRVKSRPTNLSVEICRDTSLQASSNSLQPKNSVYSDPEEVQDAWKTHGYGSVDYENREDENPSYAKLNYLQPIGNEGQRRFPAIDCREESEASAIYSKINSSAKKSHHAAKSEN